MENISTGLLFTILALLIVMSAFFSAAETAMMAINRYRLRHLVRSKQKGALRVNALLERTDRLLGVILIGNTFANVFASAVATMIAVKLYGTVGIFIASIFLTCIILVFAEVGPKTFAATYPESIAFFASWPLKLLLKLLYPLVWMINFLTNGLLRLIKVKIRRNVIEQLTSEELSTLVVEAGELIPDEHQAMLLAILNLEKITVDDVMIPRNDIVSIDLEDDLPEIINKLNQAEHTLLPVYSEDINNVKGVLEIRVALKLLNEKKLTKDSLLLACEDAYFIPESSPLPNQLLQFRAAKKRLGLVVDEYGDVIGLVTLADILEEIVGEFSENISSVYKGVQSQLDGSYLVSGSINIRDLNRILGWSFDIRGPKTLNGLITEYLEMIPQPGICLRLSGYPIEILKVTGNTVKIARILPSLYRVES